MTERRNEVLLDDTPAELKASILALFCGDEIDASRWLNQTCPALGQKTPAETIMNSPEGEAIVRDVIIQIEHGVHQ